MEQPLAVGWCAMDLLVANEPAGTRCPLERPRAAKQGSGATAGGCLGQSAR